MKNDKTFSDLIANLQRLSERLAKSKTAGEKVEILREFRIVLDEGDKLIKKGQRTDRSDSEFQSVFVGFLRRLAHSIRLLARQRFSGLFRVEFSLPEYSFCRVLGESCTLILRLK